MAMVAYASMIALIFFTILRKMNRFRIGDTIEIAGMDLLDFSIGDDIKSCGLDITKGTILTLDEKQKKARLKYSL